MHPNRFLKGRSGIYGIRNLINGKIYVGKTTCFYRRCAQYLYDFNTKRLRHINDYLIRSMSTHGIENFEFFPLEFCGTDSISERELHWITELGSTDRRRGYNLRLDSSSGMTAHLETRNKISKNLRAQWASGIRSDHGEKLKEAWSRCSPERRRLQSDTMRALRTKYEYLVTSPSGESELCNFKRLSDLGLKNAHSVFFRKKTDIAIVKGFHVIRRPIGEVDYV